MRALLIVLVVSYAAGAGAQVVGKGFAAKGGLTAASARKAVDAGLPGIKPCWDELKKSNPGAAGRLVVRATITLAGAVTDVKLDVPAGLANARFEKCVSTAVLVWKFPAPKEAAVALSVPVLLGVVESEKKELAEVSGELAIGSGGGAGSAPSAPGRGTAPSRAPEPAPPPPSEPVVKDAPPSPKPSSGKSKPKKAAAEAPRDELSMPSAVTRSTSPEGARSDAVVPSAPAARKAPIAAPALRAGRYDDNKQYNRFLAFMSENARLVPYPVDVSERLVVRVLDPEGKSLHNCGVEMKTIDGRVLARGTTYADGGTQFFPADVSPASARDYVVSARCGGVVKNGQLGRTGRRVTEVRFDAKRVVPARVPVDVAILFDTSGSMQSQIDRLKKTLAAIHLQLTSLSTNPDIRFGLVAYRDRGDDYLTQVWPFTASLEEFQKVVDGLYADGGGDTPEDMQSGLDEVMHELAWRSEAVRVGFIVADAIPHTDYGQTYTYLSAMREALERGIKWVSVGVGGLPREGEVIFRQIAQFTMGEYVFVTEGAAGDSEGGVGEASHHVGANYVVENLDQAIVRIVRRELSYLTDAPKEVDDTIVASGPRAAPRDAVLAPAVAEALRQLADYSSLRLGPRTPVAVVPVTANDAKYKDVAGYISDQFAIATSRDAAFKLVERDLAALAQEQKIQFSDLFDVKESVPFGKLIGADVLIVAKLTVRGEEAELFAKLLRVETGEVLSVAKVTLTGGMI